MVFFAIQTNLQEDEIDPRAHSAIAVTNGNNTGLTQV